MQIARMIVSRRRWAGIMTCALALLAAAPATLGETGPAPTPTLDRIRQAGRIKLGYGVDARPFSYRDETGQAAGYSVALCQRVAEAVKGELNLPGLAVEWVPVTVDNRFTALQQGEIDMLCRAETVTLERRKQMAFSIPVFPGGIGALLRSDASARLQETLEGRGQVYRPVWRGSVTQLLQTQTFSVVAKTTAETWLTQRRTELNVSSKVLPVGDYESGVQGVLDRRSNVFFAERAILLDTARRSPSARNLKVLDRLFTYEPLALAFGRGDESFRLLVDRTLSQIYGSAGFGDMYTKWFGEPDETALTFFRWNALPE